MTTAEQVHETVIAVGFESVNLYNVHKIGQITYTTKFVQVTSATKRRLDTCFETLEIQNYVENDVLLYFIFTMGLSILVAICSI